MINPWHKNWIHDMKIKIQNKVKQNLVIGGVRISLCILFLMQF